MFDTTLLDVALVFPAPPVSIAEPDSGTGSGMLLPLTSILDIIGITILLEGGVVLVATPGTIVTGVFVVGPMYGPVGVV
jgi:hypothetical protein